MRNGIITILLMGLIGMPTLCISEVTNVYHFQRTFVPVEYTNGIPTAYSIFMGARELTGIVGATNVVIVSNQTYASEYEGFAWGYDSHWTAWTSALAVHPQYVHIHSNVFYDNAGYVKGTREAYSNYGAFVWYLKNTITFTTSTSSIYVDASGVTSPIASVLVGSLGDFCPETVITDLGPFLNTNFLGNGNTEDYIAGPDLTTYYKLVPSTYLGVNSDDSDADGVPDYADGFNWDGVGSTPDDVSTNDYFTSWPIMLSGNINPGITTMRFFYSASNPMGVTHGTNGYAPASGHFRLWRKQALHARNPASITNGGDFITPGIDIPASALGFSANNRIVDLYVEAVRPGTNLTLFVDVSVNKSTTWDGWEYFNFPWFWWDWWDEVFSSLGDFICLDRLEISLHQVATIQFKIGVMTEWSNFNGPQKLLFSKDAYLLATNIIPPTFSPPSGIPSWEGTFGVIESGLEVIHTYSGVPSLADSDIKTVRTEWGPDTPEAFLVCTKVLGIHSGVGPNAGFTDGHAWVSITDYSSGLPDTTTYGLWPDAHPNVPDNGSGSDVREGMEPSIGLHNRYYLLSPSQFNAFDTFIISHATWGYTYTCANWAEDAYFAGTSETVDSSDLVFFGTPRKISASIIQLEADHPTTSDIPFDGGEEAEGSSSGSSWGGSSFID